MDGNTTEAKKFIKTLSESQIETLSKAKDILATVYMHREGENTLMACREIREVIDLFYEP